MKQYNVVKKCTKCKQDKAAEDFHKGRTECKECQKEYQKGRYQQNAEKIKEQRKAYYKQNAEKIKKHDKAYREQNAEKIKKRGKAYREQNAEKIKKYGKAWYQQNYEKIKEQKKAYYEQNREKISEQQKAYRKQNREKRKEYGKAWYQQNREKIREKQNAYYQQNAEKFKERQKAYHQQNREKINERRKAYYQQNREYHKAYHKQNRDKIRIYIRNKYKTDINFKLRNNLRRRVGAVLKRNFKSKNTLKLLGCSVDFLKKHLENQFQPGMSWNNYGNPNGDHSECWHIDHIVPCASFDLSDPKQQQKCFHYTNLQPLWAEDNMSKGAKLT